jgi:hypothetical protein
MSSYAHGTPSLTGDQGGLRPEPSLMRGVACVVCGSERVTRISMTLTDGTPVDFTSCHVCEHRAWQESAGDALGLAGVLERARKLR